ncbi:MAG: ribonuclease III [Clostridiales bacterium]|jgi:ribonuclease-3|nr:ribonuclease III [Clostridiales bacterium]
MKRDLQEIINYRFKDISLLEEALTHSSYANEQRKASNERLEFLGDAALQIVVSEWIFRKWPEKTEGELSRARSIIVCERTIAQAARVMRLGSYMRFGHGEASNGGFEKPSILADAFEALLGAVFLDGGISQVKKICQVFLENEVNSITPSGTMNDFKSNLQEHFQKTSEIPLIYEICSEKGPGHNKVFGVNVYHNDVLLGTGEGKSKKEAEQRAAQNALENIQISAS